MGALSGYEYNTIPTTILKTNCGAKRNMAMEENGRGEMVDQSSEVHDEI
jgi:hypothetical protein